MTIRSILICTSQTPLVRFGGTESLVSSLRRALVERGFLVDVVRIPFRHHPKEELLKGHLVWRLLDLTESEGQKVDMVIATKFPSYLVRHPNKVTWLVQQFRQAYDWIGTEMSPFTSAPEDKAVVQAIHQLDTLALAESRRLFAISENVAGRLARYNHLTAQPLFPPPSQEGQYYNTEYGDYILSPSRLNRLKRVHLLIEAMALVKSKARCVIVGEGPAERELKRLVLRHRLQKRVRFVGAVDDHRLLDLYAGSFAVYFAPYDEDYGLVTIEAFKSQKPVVTAADSGGVLEFVRDGQNGCVARQPSAQEMASAIDLLFEDRAQCARLGQAGLEMVRSITWDRTVDQLLGR